MDFTGERFIPGRGLEAEIELEHWQRYLAAREIVAGRRVLDIASGAGYGSALLAERAARVCGADIDCEAVSFARERYKAANLGFLQASVGDLPFAPRSFEAVISFETIEHVPAPLHDEFMREVLRVLTPDGFLLISTPDRHIYSELTDYKNEFHVKEFYRPEFEAFLGRFFPNIRLLDQFQELSFILTDNKAESCRVWQSEHTPPAGKYIIALCGRQAIPDTAKLGSVIFDSGSRYQQKINRILELQDEIVEKNQNIADCWDMLHERDAVIERISGEARRQELEMRHKERDNVRLRENVDRQQRLIAELSDSLNHIQSTRAWKIIQKFYRLKNKLRG
ncbi:class I SAM-dependent methyltransferase [Desulfobacterota bacterium M19]